MYVDWATRLRERIKTQNDNRLRIWIFSQKLPFSVGKKCFKDKEQGSLGIKNGPVSKFNEIGKVAQQHFTCFRTLYFIQMYQFVFLVQLFEQSIVLSLN